MIEAIFLWIIAAIFIVFAAIAGFWLIWVISLYALYWFDIPGFLTVWIAAISTTIYLLLKA